MGFPSPASDYVESRLSLDQLAIARPAATYFFKAGNDYPAAGIVKGAMIIVDSSITPFHGAIVLAPVDGEYYVRRFIERPVRALQDLAHCDRVTPIQESGWHETEAPPVFGVVTYWLTPASALNDA